MYTGTIQNGTLQPHLRVAQTQPFHQIIQLDHLPGVDDMNALLAQGYTIVSAVPDNALMVLAPASSTFSPAGVRWTGELEAADKLSPELAATPAGQPILAIVEFHADVDAGLQQTILAAAGIPISPASALLPNHLLVNAPLDRFQALAANDEVAYIFPADAGLLTGNDLMPCQGMLTLAGAVAQYANILHGWDLDADHAAHLGYFFSQLTSKVPASTVQSEVLRALSAWSAVANVTFQQAASATAVRTIQIEFAAGAHGDSFPFDGAGGVLAHTFYPLPINPESIAGDIHLDADENWHSGGDIDIYSVVLHEIGHALGLGHTDKPGDVMYPYYRRGMVLSANDIGAVQQLYGAPGAVTVPVSQPAPAPAPAAPAPTPVPAPAPVPPVAPHTPLSLTFNPIAPAGQAAQIAIAGTVTGGVFPITLQYQTDHGYTGSIVAGPSGAWSAAAVTLATGANTITVTAFDATHQTISSSASANRTAPATATPTGPVSIAISSPSSAVTTAKTASISLSGTATGGTGIAKVTWQTSGGASGTASGTDHWVASNVPVLTGTNTIVVRAYDARGVSAWASVVVVRQ